MTTRYEITKAIRQGKQLYACVKCERIWTEETSMTPIEYPVPSWIMDRQLLSHGVCIDYLRNREKSDDKP